MKRVVSAIALLLLTSVPTLAYSNFPPTYQPGVPDLLDDLLTKRGAAKEAVQQTKNAVARTLVADAAAVGQTVRTYSWVTGMFRANLIGLGLTAVAITADQAYKWYTDDGGQTITDWNGNIPSITGQNIVIHSGWLKHPTKPEYGEIVGWSGYYRSCKGGTELISCLDDNALTYLWYVYLDAGETPGWKQFRDYKVSSFTRDCSQSQDLINMLQADPALKPNYPRPWEYGIGCHYAVTITYTVVDNPSSWFPTTSTETVTEILPIDVRPSILAGTSWRIEDDLPECEENIFQADLSLCASGVPLVMPNTVAYPQTEKPGLMPAFTWNAKPNPEAVTVLLDDLWKRAAAMSDYKGVPYAVDDPLTAEELNELLRQGQVSLTLDGLLSPVADPKTDVIPWAPTVPSTGTPGGNPNPDPGTDPNPGGPDPEPEPEPEPEPGNPTEPNPGVGEPRFPDVPTIQQIMDPVLNVFPTVKQWSVPTTSGQCPKPSFDVYDRHFVIEAHCDLAEDNRAVIGASFMLVYAFAAVLIVLRA